MADKFYWAEKPLPDDPNNSEQNRKQVVIGFNFPGLPDDDLIEISTTIICKNKNTGEVESEIRQPNINIYGYKAKDLKVALLNNVKTLKEVLKEILKDNE